MATVVNATSWSHVKGAGSPFTVTIPAATAGNTLVVVIGGGAIATVSGFTKRTTYGNGAQDVSISDKVAAGGETSVSITLGGAGDNVSGVVYELHGSLTFVGWSNNGSGASIQQSGDFQLAPTSSVTAASASLVVAIWTVATATAYSTANRFRQFGPIGQMYGSGGNQPGSNTQFIWASGICDVTSSAAYPANLSAGNYRATSVYLAGGTGFVAQALYADSSGVATNTAPANNIVGENSLPGTHYTNWLLLTAGTDSTIAGYTDKASYAPGDTVNFKVDSTSNPFRVEIYRLGWYGWETMGARNILGNQAGYLTGTVTSQSAPTVDSTLGSVSCAWTTNATWAIPSSAVPGVYAVVYRRTDVTTHVAGGHFVVRGNTAGAVFVVPGPTYQAYNCWGATTDSGTSLGGGTWTGRSLYQIGTDGASSNFAHRAYAVSYDRPYATQSMRDMTYLWDTEHGWIVFAEAQGYSLGYCDEIDLDTGNVSLTSASMVIMVGHHEYLSTAMYNAFQAARDAGVNFFIQSANTAGWRVRFAGGDTNRRTLICYKDSGTRDVSAGWTGTGYDPVTPTGSWRDASSTNGTPNPDLRRENALTGQIFTWSGPTQTTAQIDFAHKGSPIWRNSASVQALTTGTTYTTISNTVGYEVDSPDGSSGQPANLAILFSQSFSNSLGANANGTVYNLTVSGNLGFTIYRASSGALVFNAGSWRGFWDVCRRRGASNAASGSVGLDLQNALLCILYDLGATPQTLQALQPGSDSAVTNPATGAPTGGRNGVALAYGLSITSSSAFFEFF